MRHLRNFVAVGILAAVAGCSLNAVAPAAEPVAGPKNESGITATLLVDKDTYPLNPTQSGKTFRDKLDDAKKNHEKLPTPPTVDFTLRLTNAGDKEVTITLGGDTSVIEAELRGPGAVTMENLVPMTMEFRMGHPVILAPGKTTDVKIPALSFGRRGITQLAYWTEPGEYHLTVTLTYTEGEKQVKVVSAPATIKVEAAK